MNNLKNQYQSVGKLYVNKILYNFVNNELLKNTKIKSKKFWEGLDKSLYELREKTNDPIKLIKTLDAFSTTADYDQRVIRIIKKIRKLEDTYASDKTIN